KGVKKVWLSRTATNGGLVHYMKKIFVGAVGAGVVAVGFMVVYGTGGLVSAAHADISSCLDGQSVCTVNAGCPPQPTQGCTTPWGCISMSDAPHCSPASSGTTGGSGT